jgi:hypothetical protein
VDAMITNFHLPKSTLIMLVSAFAGRERILSAYETAIQEGYRFYSFGDAMLIFNVIARRALRRPGETGKISTKPAIRDGDNMTPYSNLEQIH